MENQTKYLNSSQKKSSISQTMLLRLTIVTIIVNFILLCIIGTYSKNLFRDAKTEYLIEIGDNITTSIEQNLEEYLAVTNVLAQGDNVVTLLEESSKSNPMENHSLSQQVVEEMNRVAQLYPTEVVYIAVLSVAQDSYLLSSGGYSDDSFSFQTRPYYAAVTQKSNYITEPYLDTETGTLVVSVCAPVYGSTGQITGIVLLDLSTSFVSHLVSDSTFGESGHSIIFDNENNIIAYSDASYIGSAYTSLDISGGDLVSELGNPSGTLFQFDHNDVVEIGAVGHVGDYGWKILTAMQYREYDDNSIMVLRTLLFLMIISAIVVVFCAFNTVRRSLKPLADIKQAMHELATGNTHYELDYVSNNEIGDLASDLRFTTQNLASYIDEIHRMLSSCSQGDFTVKTQMEFLGDFANIQKSISDFTILISEALNGIKETVDQVSMGSEYVASGAHNLAEGSTKQSDGIRLLNSHIRDVTEKVKDNVDNVKYVNKRSEEMTTGLKESEKQIQNLVESMEEISRTSEGIQRIVKTIEDVAFQTNILALNAAVEAARAGSAGKGFAVVAEEVRNLSTRTSDAVHETSAMIEETVSAVRSGGVIMQETVSGLGAVMGTLDGFMSALDAITVASEEQSVAIDEISHNVDEITAVMQTNSAISEESAATSEELSSQAAMMKSTVNQFKTAKENLYRHDRIES